MTAPDSPVAVGYCPCRLTKLEWPADGSPYAVFADCPNCGPQFSISRSMIEGVERLLFWMSGKGPRTYICSSCGGEYEYAEDWTDDDALAEAEANGFDDENDLNVIVCDDCYKSMGLS